MGSPYVVRDTLVPVSIFIDMADPEAPRVLAKAEEAKLEQANLPANIKKETSHWRRPNWCLATLINSNSYVETPKGGQRFDMTKFTSARIRCLMVDWSLKEADPTLALEKVSPGEVPSIQLLSDKTMAMIGSIQDEIMNGFYRKAMAALYPSAEDEEEEGEKAKEAAPKN